MHIRTRNINTAFNTLVELFQTGLKDNGFSASESVPIVRKSSRYGDVRMIEEPVLLTYTHPRERVLFNTARDANPFMHVYEAIWMLAGRRDVAPLAYYAKKMQEFSDDGETLNGAYGYRWRMADVPYGKGNIRQVCDGDNMEYPTKLDQLDILVAHLKAKPDSRRAVLQMWNVEDDLLKIDSSKDVCCNLSVMFSLREEKCERCGGPGCYKCDRGDGDYPGIGRTLDMTVTNRSNDMIWGLLGANYVHFSFLQEYMAARLGCEVGVYNHFTNNLHCYDVTWKPEEWMNEESRSMGYPKYDSPNNKFSPFPLVSDPHKFENELPLFVTVFDGATPPPVEQGIWTEPFLMDVADPMMRAFYAHKQRDYTTALEMCSRIKADDWKIAATNWITKRQLIFMRK